MGKNAAPEREVSPELKELLDLLSADNVDVDRLVSGEPVAYQVTDVRGETRTWEIPFDIPLPKALRLTRAVDVFRRSRMALLHAKSAKAQDSKLEDHEAAWGRLLEAFLDVLRLLQPEATLELLRDGHGANVMEQWIEAVALRMELARVALGFAEASGEGTGPKAAPARPRPKPRKKKRR